MHPRLKIGFKNLRALCALVVKNQAAATGVARRAFLISEWSVSVGLAPLLSQ